MKILLLDNYDSFTYNLLHYLEDLTHQEVAVFRNDEISLEAVNQYNQIVLSPGPGLPDEAGILIPLIKQYASQKKILGVCLGHQALALAFGGQLLQLNEVMHGLQRTCKVEDETNFLFKNIPNQFEAGRYHSWVVDRNFLSKDFKITATDKEGNIMAMQHREYSLTGVQFHPESIMTEWGKEMLRNWVQFDNLLI